MAKILIVDDNPDWQKSLQGLLVEEGYQITTAGDEAEALSAAVQTSFDLAIIDVRLHGDFEDDSGLSLALALKKLAPQMKVVLLTGYLVRAEQVVKSIKLVGVEDFIEKSTLGVGDVDLATTVEEILREPPCNLTISLDPRQVLRIRATGCVAFTQTSRKPLDLDPARFTRRGNDLWSLPSRRFNLKEIGRDLYRLLFLEHPTVLGGYHLGLGKVSKYNRLHFAFESTRDLIGVPLEFLFSDISGEYLALTHPLTRRIRNVTTEREPLSPDLLNRTRRRNQKLRVLLISSDTKPPIAAIDEIGAELQILLAKHGWIKADLILTADATYERIRGELKECQYDIVQYIGHGLYDETSPEQSSLFFWEKTNRVGKIRPMKASELKLLLQNSEVRLLHLACCEGAREGQAVHLLDDDFLGIADAAIQSGVPSVLSFRWPVSVLGARKFAIEFYKSLVNQGSPELALLEARRELAGPNRDDPTWASPILIVQR
jgi:ActR/RegA family two-component response regulator